MNIDNQLFNSTTFVCKPKSAYSLSASNTIHTTLQWTWLFRCGYTTMLVIACIVKIFNNFFLQRNGWWGRRVILYSNWKLALKYKVQLNKWKGDKKYGKVHRFQIFCYTFINRFCKCFIRLCYEETYKCMNIWTYDFLLNILCNFVILDFLFLWLL